MIKNYQDFKIEILLERLLLESKINFSNKFVDLIKMIKNNRIVKELLRINNSGVDADFKFNYIDLSDKNDEVSFTPDAKAQSYLGENFQEKYKVSSEDKILTHSPRNKEIFRRLNYTPPPTQDDAWNPVRGTIGIIKAEAQSNMSTRMYVWFELEDGTKKTVINKAALVPYDERINTVWNHQRTRIKIGRFVRGVLTAAGVDFTDKEINEFVNSFKSTCDILSNAFLKFELVKGYKIAEWYSSENYEKEESTLGQSCMRNVDSDYFDIYCKNTACSMLILYSDGGSIIDGQYRSTTIKGRALVWQTNDGIFMDRIYTNYDSDVDLFKKYAFEKGWWCKVNQNSSQNFTATDGKTTKNPILVVQLELVNFGFYPYVDTLCYLNRNSKKISNNAEEIEADIQMQETGGDYVNIED
jgi:hypothetical protein